MTQAFGWPEVTIWPVWHAEFASGALADARYATRSIAAIAPYSDVGHRRASAAAAAAADVTNGALASVAAFEPARWTLVRFQLWRSLPEKLSSDAQAYTVGHVSLPKPN